MEPVTIFSVWTFRYQRKKEIKERKRSLRRPINPKAELTPRGKRLKTNIFIHIFIDQSIKLATLIS